MGVEIERKSFTVRGERDGGKEQQRRGRGRGEKQLEIMTEGKEEGKPLCFGKDSRKLERQKGNPQERKCKSKREGGSRQAKIRVWLEEVLKI